MTAWTAPLATITLFADDFTATRDWYSSVFDLPAVFEDEVSAVFRLDAVQLNVLNRTAAPELVAPMPLAAHAAGASALYTINVDDVDATYALLAGRGVEFLNGPIDRPWGVRTAAFADPAGHVWEIAS